MPMSQLFAAFGSRLVFSKRHRCVRHGVVWFVTHSLATAGVVLFLMLVLILLGLADVYLPVNRHTLVVLSRLFV